MPDSGTSTVAPVRDSIGRENEVEDLTARADLARSRMANALSALERRRHEVIDVELPVVARTAIVAIVVVSALAAVVVLASRAIAATRRRRRGGWTFVAPHVPRLGSATEPGRPALVGLMRMLIVGIARAVFARLLDGTLHGSAAETDEAPYLRAAVRGSNEARVR